MTLTLDKIEVPLYINEDGVVLVQGTRVGLDTLVYAYRNGDSPEQIVDSYDVLTLEQVYAVIAYYLHNQEAVDAYVKAEEEAAAAVRREIEENHPEMLRMSKKLAERKRQQA